MIPLCWITYNKNSSDQVYQFLTFYYSKSPDGSLIYHAFAPFYGYNINKESHIIAILLILYWKEYYAEEKWSEHSFIWPLFNIYNSPKRSGWRFLPLIWHGEYKKKNIHTSRYVSLLHYSHIKTDIKTGNTLHRTIFSPLFYNSKRTNRNSIHMSFYEQRRFSISNSCNYIRSAIASDF